MKKVSITVIGVQGVDGQKERVTTKSIGTIEKMGNGYLLKYSENATADVPAVSTEFLVRSDKTATLTRNGGIKSKLIISEGKSSNCLYSTPVGSINLTVTGERVNYRLTEMTGEMYLSYKISQNGNLISKNEVRIIIKEV